MISYRGQAKCRRLAEFIKEEEGGDEEDEEDE